MNKVNWCFTPFFNIIWLYMVVSFHSWRNKLFLGVNQQPSISNWQLPLMGFEPQGRGASSFKVRCRNHSATEAPRKERQNSDTESHGIPPQPPWFFYVPGVQLRYTGPTVYFPIRRTNLLIELETCSSENIQVWMNRYLETSDNVLNILWCLLMSLSVTSDIFHFNYNTKLIHSVS